MRKVILLALFMPFVVYGQVIDNFEAGTLNNWLQSSDGRWKADTISAVSGRFSLHHSFDNQEAATDKIGLQVKNLHLSEGVTKWSFLVKHAYDPSSSNNWAVFLMSDRDPVNLDIGGGSNGFAIGVNLTGYDDTLRLVKVKGSVITTVVNCGINWQTSIGISEYSKITVERSPEGNWGVSVYSMNGSLLKQIYGIDKEVFIPVWFTVWYKYSSTRDRLIWIDDINIEGVFYEDTEAPYITKCKESGKRSVVITLSEQPVDEFLNPGNFGLNSIENRCVSVVPVSPLIYNLEFTNALTNRSLNELIINKICDKAGNCSSELSIPFTPDWAEAGDVIISEIMADPLPEVSLPGEEYIEFTNRTGDTLNLENWKLFSGDQEYLIPQSVINPHEILIICQFADVTLFSKFGRVVGLKQFPLLNDGGKLLYISDSTGTLIHGVEYSSEWYGDELKSEGGWSLEMADSEFPFYAEGNWSASGSRKGGTPGAVNSVAGTNTDKSFYGIENVFPDDSSDIRIRFSEPVFGIIEKVSNIKIGGKEVTSICTIDPLYRLFLIKPSEPLVTGNICQMEISGDLKDFAGNAPEKSVFSFGIDEPAAPGDILFNEILFNPLEGDPDYIEFFNTSDKIINLSRLQVVSTNDETRDTSQLYSLSIEPRCFLPGSYYVITTGEKSITDRYPASDYESVFEISALPSMNDDEGHLILYNRELDMIDEVIYNEKMHYSLLSDNEGVALEKTSPYLASKETVNWHSAAESAGWGTPGVVNSLYIQQPVLSDLVTLSSSKISPDGDGFEDFLTITLSLTGNGSVISITVFDETGNHIKKIASNLLAAPEATLLWEGTADDGTPVRTGIYIIYITLFNDSGKTEKWKKVCTVIR
jgi:hypothetical protein